MIYNDLSRISDAFEEGKSERALARALGLSRTQWRQLKSGASNPTIKTLVRLAEMSGLHFECYLTKADPCHSEDSVAVSSALIEKEGVESWSLHLMNFVDRFRKTKDRRLILLPPVFSLDPKIRAIFACTVEALCCEIQMSPPDWLNEIHSLKKPFFVSGIENLKASALAESPISFRKRNVFVLDNFLQRV